MPKRDEKTLARLAAMTFRKEEDVATYFVSRLIELLGYDVPGEAPREEHLQFVTVNAGREKYLPKRPDFLVRTGGRALLVIETKAPGQPLDRAAIDQALSYARHEEIRAPLTMLANGKRILLLESDTRHPLLDFPHSALVQRFGELYLLLSKSTLGSTIDGQIRRGKRLGSGAFGTVYEGFNLRLKRREAVKIYHFSADDRDARRRRFRQGLVAQARLAHPNIATVYGTLEYGSELAVRMQYIDGLPLDRWLRTEKPSIRERVLVLAEAAETVQFAHEQGVVHRDLKPSNVIITKSERGWRPVIVDFDTAVVIGESTITQSAERFGAFGYIDPEMLDGRSHKELRDPRSDVYALGRVLEFLLTGKHPAMRRDMRDLDAMVRRAASTLTPREQNLLIEVLLPATAEKRAERIETAAALASDLRAIFDERVRGDRNAEQYADAVFEELDVLVVNQQLPLEWENLISRHRRDEVGRYTTLRRFGELDVLYDSEFYSFYIGPVIAEAADFDEFRRSKELRELRRIFGSRLRIDPITATEDGAANLIIRYFDIRKQTPAETAAQFAESLRSFLRVLQPPAESEPAASIVLRDILAERERWPKRAFTSRTEFKKLAKEIRATSGADLARSLLPFLHLMWPEARLAPELSSDGVDIVVGAPISIAIHASGGDIASTRRAVESFRGSRHRVRDFIVVIHREEQTVAYRKELQASLDRVVGEGRAEEAIVWNHRDDVVYLAFEMMLQRILAAIERWNAAMLDEQARIERTLGAAPVRNVPFSRSRLQIDASKLWSRDDGPKAFVGDVVDALLNHDERLIHVIIGTAGFGKTTAAMRAVRERALQWLVIPAAKIRRDAANAQTLFETALDFDELLTGAIGEERAIWQRIAGPVLKYLTQFRSGIGVIVDALDESPVIGRSYDLHTFFNLFRRAVVPTVITMRSEFWARRRDDLVAGKSAVESTVQTLDVIDLQPWTDAQIIEAARLRLGETRQRAARERIETFIAEVNSGGYLRFYGDIPRTPLFLRFILDALDRRDPRNMSRHDLFRYWAEQKIARDVNAPKQRGGERLPIRRDARGVTETIAASFRAMTEAAVCMTEIRDGAVALLPDCTFESIRAGMEADAPDSAESLTLTSLLITTANGRLRFAHRLFQEFFLAQAAERFAVPLPESVLEWVTPAAHATIPRERRP